MIDDDEKRAAALAEESRNLRAEILEIEQDIRTNTSNLFELVEKGEVSEVRLQRMDNYHEVLKEQQGKLASMLVKTDAERAKLEAKLEAKLAERAPTTFCGESEARALIGPELTNDLLPSVDELSDYLLQLPSGRLPVDAGTFTELQQKCARREGFYDPTQPDAVRFLYKVAAPKQGFPPSEVDLGWLVRKYDTNCVQAAIAPVFHVLLPYLLRCVRTTAEYLRSPSSAAATAASETTTTTTSGDGASGSAGAASGAGGAASTGKRPRMANCDNAADMRPNFMLHIDRLLVLRGEEREGGGDPLPIEALHGKLPEWNPAFFGHNVPYVIGYAVAGERLAFFVLHPRRPLSSKWPHRPVPTKCTLITDELNLRHATDRILLVQYVVNLVRVLQALGRIGRESNGSLLQLSGPYKMPREFEYSTIAYEATYVRKMLLNVPGDNHYAFDELEALYELVKEGKVVNTIQCKADYPTYGDDGLGAPLLTLHLFPLGRRAVPATAESLRRCLLTVLGALDSMHAHGFCHRDVRWPNILQKADEEWMLIDLEFARKMSSSEAPWPFWVREDRDNDGWPQRRGEDGGWRRADDVWMVGGLLVGVEVELDLQSIEQEIKQCTTCAEAKAVVLRRIVVVEGGGHILRKFRT